MNKTKTILMSALVAVAMTACDTDSKNERTFSFPMANYAAQAGGEAAFSNSATTTRIDYENSLGEINYPTISLPKALREGRIVYDDSWEIPDRDEKGNLFEESLREWEGMDAFVCNCDFTADLLIRSLEAKGCRIPEDVSVVGVDDFLPRGMNNDRITTYRVDMDHMAELCVKSLVKKINGKKYTEGIQIVT